jgi:K+-sensing histidine kinase KdpD
VLGWIHQSGVGVELGTEGLEVHPDNHQESPCVGQRATRSGSREFQQDPDLGNNGPVGLGIGLALVKSLVELHSGSAAASSDGLGTGAEFIVQLPAFTN